MAKFDKTAKISLASGAAIVVAIVGGIAIHKGVVHQQKVSQCEAAEALIVQQLNEMESYDTLVMQKLQLVENMRAGAEVGGLFGWVMYGPKIKTELAEVDNLQDELGHLRDFNRQTAELYRTGSSCELSEEYRKDQWVAKFLPIVGH